MRTILSNLNRECTPSSFMYDPRQFGLSTTTASDVTFSTNSRHNLLTETDADKPAVGKLGRKSSNTILPDQKVLKVDVIRFRKFKKDTSWFYHRFVSYLLSWDVLMFKFFVFLGWSIFDDFDYLKFSMKSCFYAGSEAEWKDFQKNWSSLVLQLPRCAWMKNDEGRYRFVWSGDLF